jgi:hypothetical protein
LKKACERSMSLIGRLTKIWRSMVVLLKKVMKVSLSRPRS